MNEQKLQFKLFAYFLENHRISLTESEIDEIIRIVQILIKESK